MVALVISFKNKNKEEPMQFLKILILSILFCFLPILANAKNQVLYFEPKVVELSGFIKTLTFPGASNYESIKNGDAIETAQYLVLNQPYDVRLLPKTQMGNDQAENNVQILELVIRNDNDWPKIKQGNIVQMKGTLFHAIFGHHHTRVLLSCNQVKVVGKQKVPGFKQLDILNEII